MTRTILAIAAIGVALVAAAPAAAKPKTDHQRIVALEKSLKKEHSARLKAQRGLNAAQDDFLNFFFACFYPVPLDEYLPADAATNPDVPPYLYWSAAATPILYTTAVMADCVDTQTTTANAARMSKARPSYSFHR